MGTVDQEIN